MQELITSTTIIQRNETGFLASSLGNETVMMNLDNGDYLGLNSVASDIWNLLKEPIAVENLYHQIINLYDVTEDQCKTEVNNFLKKVSEQNMLVIHPII
ncbi:MAG: PqqD family peptide modification chaperone [Bacteroidetes bacterium]|nr:PqqD family peptide modification chaperone [Bacteroidota bacterium]